MSEKRVRPPTKATIHAIQYHEYGHPFAPILLIDADQAAIAWQQFLEELGPTPPETPRS